MIDERTLEAAEFMMVLTSLSAESFTAGQILALYRLRWQIELAFKRLKSLMHLDRLPAKDPDLARAWIYSHVLLAILIDEMTQDILDSPPCADGHPSGLDMAGAQTCP